MRKIARTLCLVLALALCLAACGGGPEKQDDEPAATLYERLGAMAAADYPSVTLTVRTAMGGEELNAVYRLTRAADGATSIDFSYEALAEYDLADPAPLAGRIETKSGSVGFDRSGAVVSSTGNTWKMYMLMLLETDQPARAAAAGEEAVADGGGVGAGGEGFGKVGFEASGTAAGLAVAGADGHDGMGGGKIYE